MSHTSTTILSLSRQLMPVVVFLFTTAGIALGQGYYHSPNDSLTAVTTVDNSVTMNITQVHPGDDTLQFVWTKLSVSMPPEWTATICDNNTCYPTLIDSGTTLPVLPGDDGLMLIHCSPFTTPGIGVIRYTIYEVGTPNQVDTLTWIVDATAVAGIAECPEGQKLFSLSGNRFKLIAENAGFTRLRVLNLNGEALFNTEIQNNKEVYLPDFAPAVYFVELSGNNRLIRQKIWYQN